MLTSQSCAGSYETGNAAYLDFGKVQMFYITVILVVVYLARLASLFKAPPDVFDALPPLDPSMVALLGISHGAYAANAAAPHSLTPLQGERGREY